MGCVRLALWSKHFFAVTMIGNNDHAPPARFNSGGHAANAGVYHLTGMHCGLKYTRVAHHIAIGKIAHHKVVHARNSKLPQICL